MVQSRTAPVYPLRRYRVEVTYRESTHERPAHELPGPFCHQLSVTARDADEARTLARNEFAYLAVRAERVCLAEHVAVVADNGVVCWQCAACGSVLAEPLGHECRPARPKPGPCDITQEVPIPKP